MASDDKLEKVLVSFMCERCRYPIRLDESLNSFSEHISAELNLPIHSNPDVDLESQATSFDHYVTPCRLFDSGNGFMLVSDENDKDSFGYQYKKNAALFDTLSNNSNIDHPLCDECADLLIEYLEQELTDANNDLEDYQKYYKKLQNDTLNEPKLSELGKILENEEAESVRLLSDLEAQTRQQGELESAIKQQREIARDMEKRKERYCREYFRHSRSIVQAEDDAKSLECQLSYCTARLDKLRNTNVFNDTFHIWYKGHFGTINNFILGRLPSAPVDWSEINAAWGQAALLLSALARKIDFTFERYKLVPCGNHSYIVNIEEHKEYPLYGSGGFKFVWDTKFDHGMTAFTDCLQQFQEHVERMESGNNKFRFPYRVIKGKIEDNEASYSIKIQLNSEEQWTKAMKFMLTNLKWGLAWMSTNILPNQSSTEISLK